MRYLLYTKTGVKFQILSSNLGKFLILLSGIFYINNIDGVITLATIGASLLAFYYFVKSFSSPVEEPDWTLVFPELAGVDETNNKTEKNDHYIIQIKKLKTEVEELKKVISDLKEK